MITECLNLNLKERMFMFIAKFSLMDEKKDRQRSLVGAYLGIRISVLAQDFDVPGHQNF